jgi:hypothetical protein
MKMKLRYASTCFAAPIEVEVNTIEDLIALCEKEQSRIIVGDHGYEDEDEPGEYSLLVYDDYIE